MKLKIISLIIILQIIGFACVQKPSMKQRTNRLDPSGINYTAPKHWVVTTFAGKAGQAGFKDGIGTSAQFNYPLRIIASADNTTLYVTEKNRIRKIDIATATVSHFAGSTNGVAAGPTVINTNSSVASNFNTPEGMVINGNYIYICDFAE